MNMRTIGLNGNGSTNAEPSREDWRRREEQLIKDADPSFSGSLMCPVTPTWRNDANNASGRSDTTITSVSGSLLVRIPDSNPAAAAPAGSNISGTLSALGDGGAGSDYGGSAPTSPGASSVGSERSDMSGRSGMSGTSSSRHPQMPLAQMLRQQQHIAAARAQASRIQFPGSSAAASASPDTRCSPERPGLQRGSAGASPTRLPTATMAPYSAYDPAGGSGSRRWGGGGASSAAPSPPAYVSGFGAYGSGAGAGGGSGGGGGGLPRLGSADLRVRGAGTVGVGLSPESSLPGSPMHCAALSAGASPLNPSAGLRAPFGGVGVGPGSGWNVPLREADLREQLLRSCNVSAPDGMVDSQQDRSSFDLRGEEEIDTSGPEATCLNIEDVENACTDMELECVLLNGMYIVPLPPMRIGRPGMGMGMRMGMGMGAMVPPEVVLYALEFSNSPFPMLPGDESIVKLFPADMQRAAETGKAMAAKAAAANQRGREAGGGGGGISHDLFGKYKAPAEERQERGEAFTLNLDSSSVHPDELAEYIIG